MPKTQLSYKKGSDNSIYDLREFKNQKYSKFDFSRKNNTTIDIGPVVPIDRFHVYPGDRVKCSLSYILSTFPLEAATQTNYFVRTHWYFIKMSAVWKGWNTFITRGRSGNIELEIPSITASNYTTAFGSIQYSCPGSLGSYLNLPSLYYGSNAAKPHYLPYLKVGDDTISSTGYNLPEKFSVLDFMAYQKICRYNYMSPNLLQDNKVWFPDDLEDHWYIDYSASNLEGAFFVPESASMPAAGVTKVANFVPSVNDNVVDIRQLRYGLYGDDYFTSAKPWLVRGNEAAIDFPLTGELYAKFLEDEKSSDISMSDLDGIVTVSDSSSSVPVSVSVGDGSRANNAVNGGNLFLSQTSVVSNVNKLYSRLGIDLSEAGSRIMLTANTFRQLMALSVWQERNTLTDGSYNSTVQVHWNQKPRAPEYEPLYLGGTTDLVTFGEVVQTSSSVSGSPLGSKASNGYSAGSSDVFDFKAEDYGIIMGVMIISPEVSYANGIERDYTDLTWDDQYWPEFANLGYQPILNQEIFVSGSDSVDKDLFAWQTRYAFLKQRQNINTGLFELDSVQSKDFGVYTQPRRFSSLPELSEQFVTMSPDNVDRSFLSFQNLPAFRLQFASNISLVRALPYQSTPETFGF